MGKKTSQKKRSSEARRRRRRAKLRAKRKEKLRIHGSEGDNEVSLFGEPAYDGDQQRLSLRQLLERMPKNRR